MVKCTVVAVWVPKSASWVRDAIRGPKVHQGKETPYCAEPDCGPRNGFAALQSPPTTHFPVRGESPAAHHGAFSQYD